jgi:hypothetical protein
LNLRTASDLRPAANLNIKYVVPGVDYAMAVTMDNQILVWGGNEHCQLGIAPCGLPAHVADAPTWMGPIPTATQPYNIMSLLTAGSTSFARVSTDESLQLYGWGNANATESTARLLPHVTSSPYDRLSPSAIGLPSEPNFEAVSGAVCSGSLCVATTSEGIIGWGDAYAPFDVFPCATLNNGICNFSAEPSFSALLGSNNVTQACVASQRDESFDKVGARVVMVTDDNRLLLAGTGMDFIGTTPVRLGWTSIAGTTFHSSCTHIDEVKCGNDFVLVRCNNTVLSFGNNEYLALGISNAHAVRSVYLPGLVDLMLDPLENVIRIAAGKNSGYVLTSEGRVVGWGSTYRCALGNPCNNAESEPKVINLTSVTRSQYIPTDITATNEQDGAFVIFAEEIGSCPPVPQTMLELFWCNQQNFYSFAPIELTTGTFEMPAGVGLQGNLTMAGDILIDMPEGMKMQGKMHVKGTASLKLKKRSEVVGEILLDQDSVTQLDNATVIITNGSLQLTSTSTIVLSNLSFVSSDDSETSLSPTFDLQESSTAALHGRLEVVVSAAITYDMMQQAANETSSNHVVALKTLVVEGREGSIDPKDLFVTVTLLQPLDSPCTTFTGSLDSTPSSLTLFVVLDSSACYPSAQTDAAHPKEKSKTTTYIIVGATLGAVLVATVITAAIILNIQTIKVKLLPYREG